jgi:hypothetical protein
LSIAPETASHQPAFKEQVVMCTLERKTCWHLYLLVFGAMLLPPRVEVISP